MTVHIDFGDPWVIGAVGLLLALSIINAGLKLWSILLQRKLSRMNAESSHD